MGFEQRKKSGNIFAGSRLVVDGQGIYNVKILKFGPERKKSPLEYFRPVVVPAPIPAPLCDFNGIVFMTPTPSPTTTVTPTPTNTVTPTPTNTITPTPTSAVCSGIPYNLSTIFDAPISGDVLFADLNIQVASNNPDGINEYGGVYFNVIDSNGTDQTSYFSDLIGNNFLLTLCQNNVTATYSGSSDAFQFFDTFFYCSLETGANFIEIISANTLFNFGEIVYIDYSVVIPPTLTPTPTITETPTQTPTPTCTRPVGLTTFQLIDIIISGSTEINITGSLVNACNALNWGGDYVGIYCQTNSISIGESVYWGTTNSCGLAATGYYIVGETLSTGYVMYIVDGVIDSFPICPTPTPTPTNTVTPTITPTNTVTPSITPTISLTPTITPTNTVTPTITPTVFYKFRTAIPCCDGVSSGVINLPQSFTDEIVVSTDGQCYNISINSVPGPATLIWDSGAVYEDCVTCNEINLCPTPTPTPTNTVTPTPTNP